MGWTSYHASTTYNPKTGRRTIDRKAECDDHLNCDAISYPDGKVIGKYEVLKSRMVGATYYAAVKKRFLLQGASRKPQEFLRRFFLPVLT
jgi:hypothetical protein